MKEGNVSMKWYPGKCFYILKKQKQKTKLKFIQTSIMLLKSNENKNLKKKYKKKFFCWKKVLPSGWEKVILTGRDNFFPTG